MRASSPTSFFLRYSQQLCGEKTTSVKRLVKHAETDAPHAREAVFFYALSVNKLPYLMKQVSSTQLRAEYESVLHELGQADTNTAFSLRKQLPPRYCKALDSFLYKAHQLDHERELIAKYRLSVKRLLEKQNMTAYSLAKALKADKSNLYAWLNAENDKKVSFALACRAYQFLSLREEAQPTMEEKTTQLRAWARSRRALLRSHTEKQVDFEHEAVITGHVADADLTV